MMSKTFTLIAALWSLIAAPALALPFREPAPRDHWECVTFARELSGIQIYGDALSWWDQAEGRYARGNRPRVGAVLSFMPYGNMRLGHVATVTEIVDARTVRLTHANWSPINGRRGQIERGVEAIDVSEVGDWTKVRVWFAPLGAIGGTQWPTHGFIYPNGSAPAPAPKLLFASLVLLPPSTLRPTGRLSYLRPVLAKLQKGQ
jgi:surface antigen